MTSRDHKFEEDFCHARGFAITQYAYYEESLVYLFAHLLEAPLALAGIPFFKINNARARVAMLERLLKKKHGDAYNLFWNSLARQMQQLDHQRNQIVHWTTICTWADTPFASLIPPNHWDEDENTPFLLHKDLLSFSMKCQFFVSVISYFAHFLNGEPFVHGSWREIFQQPIAYPPPANHPLFQTQ